MKKQTDITNKKFGRLTAIKYAYNKGKRVYWLFRCDCGTEKVILKTNVVCRKIRSCGCLHKELLSKRTKTHGGSNTPLYSIFKQMKLRCYNKKEKTYKYIGARGIKVCSEWLDDFEKFRDWALLNGYKKGLVLNRIDMLGDYSPKNCRFVDRATLNKNRSTAIKYWYDGKFIPICYIAEKLGISYATCNSWFKNGKLQKLLENK